MSKVKYEKGFSRTTWKEEFKEEVVTSREGSQENGHTEMEKAGGGSRRVETHCARATEPTFPLLTSICVEMCIRDRLNRLVTFLCYISAVSKG